MNELLNFLLIDDERDTLEHVERHLELKYPTATIHKATDCNHGYTLLKKHPIKVLVVDLEYKHKPMGDFPNGKSLIKQLQKEGLSLQVIIYTSHNELEYVYPIIENYKPNAYVWKIQGGVHDLLFAIQKVLQNEIYYSHSIHEQIKKRTIFDLQIEPVDEMIIEALPFINKLKDWEATQIPLSVRAITDRIKKLCTDLEVENEKQLVMKFQRLGFY